MIDPDNPPGGSLVDGEVRVILGHRVMIHRSTRGSGKKKYIVKCTAWCVTCGWSSPPLTNNDALDKSISGHLQEGNPE